MSYRTLDSMDKDIAAAERAKNRYVHDNTGETKKKAEIKKDHDANQAPPPHRSAGPMIHEVSPNDFILDTNVLTIKPASETVKIVMFYAPWCGACNQVKPLWNQLATHIPQVTFAQLNGDQYPDFIQRIGIKGFPTFVGFKGYSRAIYKGRRDAESFVSFLNNIIQTPVPSVTN